LTERLSGATGRPEHKGSTGAEQAVPYGDVSFIPSCRNPCALLFGCFVLNGPGNLPQICQTDLIVFDDGCACLWH
jgi:hypothetical protein